MKVSTTKITVEIDLAEWKKINKEWRDVIYGEKIKPNYKSTPLLYDFLDHINSVANNPSHIIDVKL